MSATKTTYQGTCSGRSHGGTCQYHIRATVRAAMTSNDRWRATATYEEVLDPDPQAMESCFSATHSCVADAPVEAIMRAARTLEERLSDDDQRGLVELAATSVLTG